MRLITGDECGLLKECNPSLVTSKKDAREAAGNAPKTTTHSVVTDEGIHRINDVQGASRRRGIVALAWTEPQADQQFASLHMDGVVGLWERSVTKKNAFGAYRNVGRIPNVFGDNDDENDSLDLLSRPLALSRFTKNDRTLLCACNMMGKVVVLDPDEGKRDNPILSSFSTVRINNSKEATTSTAPHQAVISTMAVDDKLSRVAVGGKERDVVLWDLNTSQQLWKAKNLPPDAQTLLQPLVWPTAICFMNEDSSSSIGEHVLAVGSAHAQVRIYDIRCGTHAAAAQRRPISVTPYGLVEHRVTSLCQMDPYRLVVGDAAGFLHAIDLRKLGKKQRVRKSVHEVVGTHGRFVGPAGSIRQVVKHSTLPRIAVVGLDRMLRVYDTSSKNNNIKCDQVSCFYLKQRLNCVLIGQEDDDSSRSDNLANIDDEDIDQEDVVDDYVDSDLEEDDQVVEGVELDSDESESASEDDSEGDSESEEEEVVHSRKKRRQ